MCVHVEIVHVCMYASLFVCFFTHEVACRLFCYFGFESVEKC